MPVDWGLAPWASWLVVILSFFIVIPMLTIWAVVQWVRFFT